jgi:hypothetical protein
VDNIPIDDTVISSGPQRGTALLVISIVIVASMTGILIIPRTLIPSDLQVRVAVIDSGIDLDGRIGGRIVAAKSFINSSYGYSNSDLTTHDSNPEGSLHGTYVARIIAQDSPYASIVNAKVIDSENIASEFAIVAAIIWAVSEQNCSVINLSLGGYPSNRDALRETIAWAFRKGVVLIAAAGNQVDAEFAGSSVQSPAVFPEVIAVGAVDDQLIPYSFSSRGPLRNRTIKPDLVAKGYFTGNGITLFGTSFAAPIVTSVATNLIAHCKSMNLKWTPGLIKSALMAGAQRLSSEAWEVGAGLVDEDTSRLVIEDAPVQNGLPLIAWVVPDVGPFEFERYFVNTSVVIEMSLFTSGLMTYGITYSGVASQWVSGGPGGILVNQTASFDFRIYVLSDKAEKNIRTTLTFIAEDYPRLKVDFVFNASVPTARVAFDLTHTPWWIDSIYGQFKEFYKKLTELGVAVEEIRDPSLLTLANLLRFDAVMVLDPCAWDSTVRANKIVQTRYKDYTQRELDVYLDYWNAGGGLFLTGLDNRSIDIASTNKLFALFNLSLNYDSIPLIQTSLGETTRITGINTHPVTTGVTAFDYNGASINNTGNAAKLAWTELILRFPNGTLYRENRTVLVADEGLHGGRVVATGTNFFIDNWGLKGIYHEESQDSKLILQIVYWLAGVLLIS